MSVNIEKNARDILSLQKDFTQLTTVVGRIDVTLEKLTELQSGISQILAVQESRLSNQERIAEQIRITMEDRRKENDENFKSLDIKMQKLEQDIETESEVRHSKIMTQLEKNNTEPKQMVKELHARIDRMEKLFFISMGVLIALGVLVDQINFASIFTK